MEHLAFYEKELQKKKKKKKKKMFRIEKVIKTKGDNLHVQWKSCDIPFNVWIDKKDIVI